MATGGSRRKSSMWYSSTRNLFPRGFLYQWGEGGAGMLLTVVWVTLLHHCLHVEVAGCLKGLQGSFPSNLYVGETLRIDLKPYKNILFTTQTRLITSSVFTSSQECVCGFPSLQVIAYVREPKRSVVFIATVSLFAHGAV